MPRFVALLRGVNVGGAKRVPMAVWRSGLETLGYTDVQTILNSGNAVFTATGRSAAAHAQAIAAGLRETLSIEVAVVVKSGSELRDIAERNPFARFVADESRMLVAFAMDPTILAALQPLQQLVQPPEAFALGRQAAYLWCDNGILACKAADVMLGRKGSGVTTRNLATVKKILALI